MLRELTVPDGLRIVAIIVAISVLLVVITSIVITILMVAQGSAPGGFLKTAAAIIAVGVLLVLGISWWLMSIHGDLARQEDDDLWH